MSLLNAVEAMLDPICYISHPAAMLKSHSEPKVFRSLSLL